MVADLAIYMAVHQPRRPKLPAQPIPRGASIEDIVHCLFDEQMDKRYFKSVAQESYYPAVRLFLDLVRQGMQLSLGISLSFVRQAAAWDARLLDLFCELVAEKNVELIGCEPYHSLLFLLDLPAFVERMQEMSSELETIFGKCPVVTDTCEMCMSAALYNALDTAGFRGAVMDGGSAVMGWRESTHLYRYGDEAPYALPIKFKRMEIPETRPSLLEKKRSGSPYLLNRHATLSDDVGLRFSDRSWSGYPLYADTYAKWIAHTQGDLLILGWDFETFGKRHHRESGIFDFLRALPDELACQNVTTYTASSLIERHQTRSSYLPLPIFPAMRAEGESVSSFLGSSAQQTTLQLMNYVYSMAKLTANPDLIDFALWLSQSDNLRVIQWFERGRSEVTPAEWWSLGTGGIIHELQQVYVNAFRAMEPYLPVRLLCQSERNERDGTVNGYTYDMALSCIARYG